MGKKFYLLVTALFASFLLTSTANAFDVATLISGSNASANSESTGTFVLGIAFGIFGFAVIRRVLGK
ncbi:hypothetical protein [Acinetobacter tjernbergiae]|uniref:Uncharacterized protein n=1 Tax=Acinetobacter tjernbergiae DSM 14971 = CIP 107465 TaxID=1120928 RepID=V2UTA6_9GAMM|nr:hypothetical protein [Acinetobacter tjernbergiae]ESK51865.1 hypothetical protein F990_03535 [Acinetobacter tjernbergiae DSM 14971 = CIP 107465]